jgi:hypothetical protein
MWGGLLFGREKLKSDNKKWSEKKKLNGIKDSLYKSKYNSKQAQ